jgi:hypothetical protein
MNRFEFRELMDKWDYQLYLHEKEAQIDDLLNKKGLILFFKKDGDIFGAPEEARLTFSKLKNPDEDTGPNWQDEAKFIAHNLLSSLMGNPLETMFGFSDLPKIQVIDREAAVKHLMKPKKPKKKK